MELSCTASLFRGVSLMPDFQYIVRPGATTLTPTAAVLGFRTNIDFQDRTRRPSRRAADAMLA